MHFSVRPLSGIGSVLIFVVVVLGCVIPASGAIRVERRIAVDDLSRRYVIYLPDGYRQKAALPVVLAFHGGFGDPDQFAILTGLPNAARAKNFIIVFAEGYMRSWNEGGVCCGQAKGKVDEVKFVRRLLADLGMLYKVDRRRVYATGYSNGGGLSYYLACTMSQEIAAIAPISSAMRYPKSACHPQRPVSILEFHGLLDRVSPYLGGVTTVNGLAPPPPVPETIAFWTRVAATKNVSHIEIFDDAAECDIYSRGVGGTMVAQCHIPKMGHRWPGSYPTSITERGDALIKSIVGDLGPFTPSLDANDIMLRFFDKFALPSTSIARH